MNAVYFIKSSLIYIYTMVLFYPCLMIQGQSATDWKKIESVDDVCLVFPDRMERLLQQTNLDMPGLESVKKAFAGKQTNLACQLLLDYYHKDEAGSHLRTEKPAVSQAVNPAGRLPWSANQKIRNNNNKQF